MTPEQAHATEGFKIVGTIAFWISAVGFAVLGIAVFHFLSWWGVLGCAGLALVSIAVVLRGQLARGETLLASSRIEQALSGPLAHVERDLAAIQDRLERIEYNALSAEEQQRLSFESAPRLTLSRANGFKEGHQCQLMLLSPTAVERFEYEHRLLYQAPGGWHDVYGFRRNPGSDQWSDFQFVVSDEGARSKDGSAIKEAWLNGPHNKPLQPTSGAGTTS